MAECDVFFLILQGLGMRTKIQKRFVKYDILHKNMMSEYDNLQITSFLNTIFVTILDLSLYTISAHRFQRCPY